ncbi:GGDEF domain-containing protein [Lysobacter niastensis]|nr:GGDEF domain-containing protein [Lysobacter niastensis]
MMRRFALAAMLAAVTPMPAIAAPATEVEQLLLHADRARGTDPNAFAADMHRLERLQHTATPAQQRQLQLLRAYQQALTGQYDKAIRDARALYAEAPEAALKFRAALLVANSAAITRDSTLGLRYLEGALALQDRIDDRDVRQAGFAVAAILYNQYGQFTLGRHYAELILAQAPSPRNRCIAQHLRIEAMLGLKAPVRSEEFLTAIANCNAQQEPIASNLLRGYLARHLASQGQTVKAIDLLEAHLPEVEATGYPRLIGEVHGLLAEYNLSAGRIAAAEAHARQALAKGGNGTYTLPLVTAHKVLYASALRRGDLATALDEYRQYADTDKARLDDVKAREFAFQVSRHELQQKNQAIALLSQQNEVLRLQQEVEKRNAQNSRLLLALLAVVLASVGFWVYRVKRAHSALRRLAHADAVTGISNRGHFRQHAMAMLAQCQARGEPVGAIVFDLDDLKAINDHLGHTGGDHVLQQVAKACLTHCRPSDCFGRLGGTEFGMILLGRDLAATRLVAEQCHESLAAIDTTALGAHLTVSASFGCTSSAESGYDFERILAQADHARDRRERDDLAALYPEAIASRQDVPAPM